MADGNITINTSRRFFLLGRNMNRGEGPRPIEHGQLAGVTPIRLDAIAGPARDQRRGDHLTRDPLRRQGALQIEATWPRLIATLD